MTSGQRKTHLILWIILGIAIPILMVLSVLEIRTLIVTDGETNSSIQTTSSTVVVDDAYFTIELMEDGTNRVLKTTLKKPLKTPSAIAYGVTKDGNEMLLGTLESKGVYTFQVNKEVKSLKVFDGIKSVNIINIEL